MTRPFRGALIALALLAACEAVLHTDAFLHRYRSVFAAGRAMDKILAAEALAPELLVLGNSRVDNGIVPDVLQAGTGASAFNLGLPGADACTVHGVVRRLQARGTLRARTVLLGLDESLLQPGEGLGYPVFFDDRAMLLEHGRWLDWLKSWIRLWGYADSLKTLQEPARLARLIAATRGEVEPWGGAARATRGHRAADAVQGQDAAQVARQEAASATPPAPPMVACLEATVATLHSTGVAVEIFFPPLLKRANAFAVAEADAYARLRARLVRAGASVLDPPVASLRVPTLFANAGHLNLEGARRYSAALAAARGAQPPVARLP